MVDTIDYENIYLDSIKKPTMNGKIKFADSGIAFKDAKTGSVVTVRSEDIRRFNWRRSARDYQIKIYSKKSLPFCFDGFPREAFDELKEFVKDNYSIQLEPKELSVKGWNWGQTDFLDNELCFTVMGKTLFELPMDDVANVVMSGKNEISIEMSYPDHRDKKLDSLVEVRFYIPPASATEATANSPVDVDDDGAVVVQEAPADVFYNTVKSMAELGGSLGEILVNLPEMPCVTPRGRYEFDMYPTFLRLRGKSYDYKVLYSSIVKLFLLPKTDDIHIYFVIGLDPPIRQGQTRYPFVVVQFSLDEDMDVEINLEEDVIQSQYEGRLQKNYEGATYEIVSAIFRGLTQKKITVPGTFRSVNNLNSVKCNLKANEGFLYPLEKSFLFIPKPAVFMPHSDITTVVFSRVGGSVSNSRSFDIKINMKSGTEYTFSSIPKEEHGALESFLKSKGIKVKNEINVDDSMMLRDAYESDDDDDSDEDAVKVKRVGPDGEEEDESEDESFQGDASSESDVAEEYDEEYDSEEENEEGGEGESSSKKKKRPAASSEEDNDDEVEEVNSEEEEEEEKPAAKKKPTVKKTKVSASASSSSKKEAAGKEGGKKKKVKKEGPKRALTAFMYFSKDARSEVVKENPNIAFGEVGKLLGARWKSMSEAEKAKYYEQEKEDKERYQKELSAFKNTEKKQVAAAKPQKQADDEDDDVMDVDDD